VEQHALRQVDEDAVVEPGRDDVGIVDAQALAGMDDGLVGNGVVLRQDLIRCRRRSPGVKAAAGRLPAQQG